MEFFLNFSKKYYFKILFFLKALLPFKILSSLQILLSFKTFFYSKIILNYFILFILKILIKIAQTNYYINLFTKTICFLYKKIFEN